MRGAGLRETTRAEEPTRPRGCSRTSPLLSRLEQSARVPSYTDRRLDGRKRLHVQGRRPRQGPRPLRGCVSSSLLGSRLVRARATGRADSAAPHSARRRGSRDPGRDQESVRRRLSRASFCGRSSATTDLRPVASCRGSERPADALPPARSFRKAALKEHPDKNPNDIEGATQRFARIQAAWECLSDPQERAWYDDHREDINDSGAGGASLSLPLGRPALLLPESPQLTRAPPPRSHRGRRLVLRQPPPRHGQARRARDARPRPPDAAPHEVLLGVGLLGL